jgi:hypothetical protein
MDRKQLPAAASVLTLCASAIVVLATAVPAAAFEHNCG